MIEHLEPESQTKQPVAIPPKILAIIKKNQPEAQVENDMSPPTEPLETNSAEVTQVKDTTDDEEHPPAVKQPLKPQLKKNQSSSLKFLKSITNADGVVFDIGSKILVRGSTFGDYNAIINEIYQTADGVVWAKYSPFPADAENPQRWGYCRASLLVHSHE